MKKTKLVKTDITLNSQEEALRCLLDKLVLMNVHTGHTFAIRDGRISVLNFNGLVMITTFHDFNIYEVYKEETIEWFDNIPERGVLCWVGDYKEKVARKNFLSIITRKDKSEEGFFTKTGIYWKCATPLTKEEALSLILTQEEE